MSTPVLSITAVTARTPQRSHWSWRLRVGVSVISVALMAHLLGRRSGGPGESGLCGRSGRAADLRLALRLASAAAGRAGLGDLASEPLLTGDGGHAALALAVPAAGQGDGLGHGFHLQ